MMWGKRVFNVLLIFISVSLFTAGCATGPSTKVTRKVDDRYSIGMSAKSEHKAKAGKCPIEEKTWKESDWKPLISMINGCVKSKKWKKVDKMASHLAKVAPQSPWGSYYLSLLSERARDHRKALWLLESSITKAPNMGILYYQKARVLWELKEFDTSVEMLSRAVELEPALVDAKVFLGQIELRDQQYSKAYELFTDSLKVEPNNLAANLGLAECLMAKNNWKEAVTRWDRVIDINPKRADARLRRAWLLENKLQDPTLALEAYKKIRYLKSKKRLVGSLPSNINEKIKVLTEKVASIEAKKVSQRKPAETKKVAQ